MAVGRRGGGLSRGPWLLPMAASFFNADTSANGLEGVAAGRGRGGCGGFTCSGAWMQSKPHCANVPHFQAPQRAQSPAPKQGTAPDRPGGSAQRPRSVWEPGLRPCSADTPASPRSAAPPQQAAFGTGRKGPVSLEGNARGRPWVSLCSTVSCGHPRALPPLGPDS